MLSNSGQLRHALLAKNESKWNQKAAAEDKDNGVAQKSPINNVANRL